jgi:sugar phosphate isomerase/epimerase
MFKLSIISDEISPQLEKQLDFLDAEEIKHIEIRSIQKKNILDFTDKELKTLKKAIQERGLTVSAISSPIGKIKLSDDYQAHYQRFLKTLEIAGYLETDRIRIFGFYTDNAGLEGNRKEILRRIEVQVKEAEKHKIRLLLENEEQSLYGGTAEQIMDVLNTIQSDSLGFLFDPGNYVYFFKKNVYPEYFNKIKSVIQYIHIKDIPLGNSHFTVPGKGDVQYKQLLTDLKATGYDGFLSMEPHLVAGDSKGGFSGTEGVRKAIHAIKNIISDIK